MEVFIFNAALHCADCGNKIRASLEAEGKRPADISDESSYDSDAFPKGPYPDGGGESDTPAHCDSCGTFLENPLTPDGLEYLRNAIEEARNPAGRFDPKAVALVTWLPHYREELESYFDHEFGKERRAEYQAESLELRKGASEFVDSWLIAATDSGVTLPCWHPDADSDNARQFCPEDIAPESLRSMIAAASQLEDLLRPILEEAAGDPDFEVPGSNGESIWDMAGHFARLEAEGHGVGFWDGRWGEYGDRLSEVVKSRYWPANADGLYFGDDGGIYGA